MNEMDESCTSVEMGVTRKIGQCTLSGAKLIYFGDATNRHRRRTHETKGMERSHGSMIIMCEASSLSDLKEIGCKSA